jgi:GNAT superfamily N-acetyltransferase
MSADAPLSVTIRAATAGDRDLILDLMAVSHGWTVDSAFRDYFEWKHHRGPLGPSHAWLAFDDDELVGYRAFLRWELEAAESSIIRAARAVDVATLPRAQRRGVFSGLTAHAIASLRAAGTDIIFTTPNEAAGQGWLRAGARDLGRLPVSLRLRSAPALAKAVRARAAASRWPIATSLGDPAEACLADRGVASLLDHLPSSGLMRTHRTIELLRWRYGFGPLGYRGLAIDDDPAQGLALFRLRRRGAAVEAAVCDLLVPRDQQHRAQALVRLIARKSGADYAIRIGGAGRNRGARSITVPRQGPRVLAMPLTAGVDVGTAQSWDLCLGDVELL